MNRTSDRGDGVDSARRGRLRSSGITSSDSAVHLREAFGPERAMKDGWLRQSSGSPNPACMA